MILLLFKQLIIVQVLTQFLLRVKFIPFPVFVLEDEKQSNYSFTAQVLILLVEAKAHSKPLSEAEDENHSKCPCSFLLGIKMTQGQMEFVVATHLMTQHIVKMDASSQMSINDTTLSAILEV